MRYFIFILPFLVTLLHLTSAVEGDFEHEPRTLWVDRSCSEGVPVWNSNWRKAREILQLCADTLRDEHVDERIVKLVERLFVFNKDTSDWVVWDALVDPIEEMLLWIEVRADGKDFEGKDIEGGEFEALKPTEIRLFCGTPWIETAPIWEANPLSTFNELPDEPNKPGRIRRRQQHSESNTRYTHTDVKNYVGFTKATMCQTNDRLYWDYNFHGYNVGTRRSNPDHYNQHPYRVVCSYCKNFFTPVVDPATGPLLQFDEEIDWENALASGMPFNMLDAYLPFQIIRTLMPSVQSKGLEPSLKTRAASNRIFANEDVTYKFVDLTQGDVATLRRSFTRISSYIALMTGIFYHSKGFGLYPDFGDSADELQKLAYNEGMIVKYSE